MTRLMTSVAAAALLALPVLAQAPTTNNAPNANQGKPPSPAAESSTQNAPGAKSSSDATRQTGAASAGAKTAAKLDAADRNFVEAAASAGTAEVKAGKMAAEKARNDAVQDFARTMVEDHSKANEKLMSLAKQHDMPLPKEPKAEHKQAEAKLKGMSGGQFDRAYMANQLEAHQKAVQLFTRQANSGQNPELKQFAAETLPTLKSHLQMAQRITEDLNRTAAGSAPGQRSGSSATDTTRRGESRDGAPSDRKAAARSGTATLEQGSTDRDMSTTRSGTRSGGSPRRGDAESAEVRELNQQQLQQIEQRRPGS